MNLRRAVSIAGLAVTVLIATPATALADPAGPTDFVTEIVAVEPDTDAFTASIVGGDAFLRLVVEPGHEVIVHGYDREPYLRFRADGIVEHNLLSFATYYNETRNGREVDPALYDHDAEPRWEQVADGGAYAWHDHRAHLMGDRPPGLEPGDSLPANFVPLTVDGQPVEIQLVTTLQASPSLVPVVVGLLVGLGIVILGALAGPATTNLAALVLSAAALGVGLTQFLSLPSETAPSMTWWLLPALALACAIVVVLVYGWSEMLRDALIALAGLDLVVWALTRQSGLTSAILPTDLPFWLDRLVTAAALSGGIALAFATVRRLFHPPAEEPVDA